MGVTLQQVVDAFELLYEGIHNPAFRKTLRLNEFGEREIAPLVRTFLLGYFGESLVPEAAAKLPGTLKGKGRIDFIVDEVAVEFAVRKPGAGAYPLSNTVNSSEAKKLIKYNGLSLLVLYDFAKKPLNEANIESFRKWPSLGKGNHYKSPFNVAYFGRERKETVIIRKNIRVT